ncbi:hypothetical protein EVAR_52819_1 [Eumeta japonica]|uniref:Uncharacterized protein n=1 Tax=Eumeta variegata TaxID=151549 RepID=A0A4C2A645_EUMVA|nr:hypothetical protein EVAR_52819_1 [Eumeta japonica]
MKGERVRAKVTAMPFAARGPDALAPVALAPLRYCVLCIAANESSGGPLFPPSIPSPWDVLPYPKGRRSSSNSSAVCLSMDDDDYRLSDELQARLLLEN